MSRLCIDLIRTWSLVKAHACTVQTAPKWPISGNTAESEQKKSEYGNQSVFFYFIGFKEWESVHADERTKLDHAAMVGEFWYITSF